LHATQSSERNWRMNMSHNAQWLHTTRCGCGRFRAKHDETDVRRLTIPSFRDVDEIGGEEVTKLRARVRLFGVVGGILFWINQSGRCRGQFCGATLPRRCRPGHPKRRQSGFMKDPDNHQLQASSEAAQLLKRYERRREVAQRSCIHEPSVFDAKKRVRWKARAGARVSPRLGRRRRPTHGCPVCESSPGAAIRRAMGNRRFAERSRARRVFCLPRRKRHQRDHSQGMLFCSRKRRFARTNERVAQRQYSIACHKI
jgi:hypothetical protein